MSGLLLNNVRFINQKTGQLSKTTDELMSLGRSNVYDAAVQKGLFNNSGDNTAAVASASSTGVSGATSTADATATSTGSSTNNKPKTTMSSEEMDFLKKMKDSNVPRYYTKDKNDPTYLAAESEKNYFWQLTEEVFLYTLHDKQKHKYITSIKIDSDVDDITTTCEVNMPYNSQLMEYYVPGQTTFLIIGGTFDREVLFVGRVSEVNQLGQTIQVVGQNIGWKFKQYMSEEFFSKIQGIEATLVVKAIFKELGFDEGKYIIDLWGIPDVDKYQIDENGSIVRDGETIENVPDLEEVVSRLKDSDINKYTASKANVKTTEEVATDYQKDREMREITHVINSEKSYKSYDLRKSYGIKTTLSNNEISYDFLEDRIFGSNKNYEYFIGDKSGQSDQTYESILNNLAAAIDAQFFIVDATVCFVSFNSMMAMSKSEGVAKAVQPTIDFWQQQDNSFELGVDQYGFYNTVIIKYKNGELKRAYDDLVRIYSEVPITYEEPDLDYEGAQLKAQAYLSAHIRDFAMQNRLTILHTGKITVASFVKIRNPLTMSESLMYVYGISVQWDARDQTLTCDLDLRYGPENPDNPTVPEVGMQYASSDGSQANPGAVYTGAISTNIAEAAQQMIQGATDPTQKAYAIYNWVDQNVAYELYYGSKYSSETVLSIKRANCWDTAYLIYKLCSAVGVKCEVHNGIYHFLDRNWGHLWNQIEINGQMVFADTGRQSQNPIGEHGAGRYIVSDTCVAKNY